MKGSVFNSLGSNYLGKQALRHLFHGGSETDDLKLRQLLSKRFDGKAFLFYKGREALKQALIAADLPKDSLVAINGFTCYAVDEAVTGAGYQNVYLDVDSERLHFSADTLEQSIKDNRKIRAVIIQNTLGFACDISAIEEICRKHKLILIEDLAHSFGLVYPDGREAGTVGDYTMLSFGRDKCIDAVSGGALIVRSKVADNWQRNLMRNGHNPTVWRQFVDRLYPFNTWTVRILYKSGLGKLKQVALRSLGFLPRATDGYFDGFTRLPNTYARDILHLISEQAKDLKHREQIAKVYMDVLPNDLIPEIVKKPAGKPVYLRFPIRVYEREILLAKLKAEHIHISDTWYDSPIAPPRFMSKTAYNGQCPNSEKTCDELLNLPTHRNISVEQARYLAERINSWL